MFTHITRSKILFAIFSCCAIITLYSTQIKVADADYFINITPAPGLKIKTEESIWSNLSRDLKLDHQTQISQVHAEIRKLLADPDKLYSILKAAGPYIYFIHEQTQARGLPAELALIPVIESEFNPNDHSTKGATGLWQLMPETAHELGISVRSSYDGRRNVVTSTNAALAYFNDLGNMFKGNWNLAIGAYNCGQVKMESAIRHAGSHVFWNLHVPRETKAYLPKLLAVAAIIKDPQKYGVTLPPVSNHPYFKTLKFKKPVNLNKISKSSGISLADLRTLNPDYNHRYVAPSKGSYILLVPADQSAKAKATFAASVTL
jgi:membrane-bound lytic murein transglycosylase D